MSQANELKKSFPINANRLDEDLCETATCSQGRSPRRAPSGRHSRYVVRFEETGNVCRGGPKIDLGIGAAGFICRE